MAKKAQLSCRPQRLWTCIHQSQSTCLAKPWWKYGRSRLCGSLILWAVSVKKTGGSWSKSEIWPSWNTIQQCATGGVCRDKCCAEQGWVERVNAPELFRAQAAQGAAMSRRTKDTECIQPEKSEPAAEKITAVTQPCALRGGITWERKDGQMLPVDHMQLEGSSSTSSPFQLWIDLCRMQLAQGEVLPNNADTQMKQNHRN